MIHRFAVEIAVVMGVKREKAEKDMEEVIRFEISLAEISIPQEELRDFNKRYNPICLSDFVSLENHPENWREFMDDVILSQNITDQDIVINETPSYFTNLSVVLKDVPKR